MTRPWRVIEEQYYEKFRLFSAKRSRRENPKNGQPFDFFLMEGLDWTNIILLNPRREIVLVEQFRQGADRVTLELPGGAVEANETPLAAATRETVEETGFTPKPLKHLGSVFANPAMQSMRLHVFLGEVDGSTQIPQALDSEEEIRIVQKPLDDFLEDVRTGRAEHALTAAAVAMFLLRK